MNLAKNLIEKLKNHFKEIVKLRTSPHSIALGFAIGTFVGIFPTPGLNFVIAGIISLLFKKISKISLFTGIIIWNPALTIPLDLIAIKLTTYFYPAGSLVIYSFSFINKLYNFTKGFLLFITLISLVISLLSYIVVRIVVSQYQQRHITKEIQKILQDKNLVTPFEDPLGIVSEYKKYN